MEVRLRASDSQPRAVLWMHPDEFGRHLRTPGHLRIQQQGLDGVPSRDTSSGLLGLFQHFLHLLYQARGEQGVQGWARHLEGGRQEGHLEDAGVGTPIGGRASGTVEALQRRERDANLEFANATRRHQLACASATQIASDAHRCRTHRKDRSRAQRTLDGGGGVFLFCCLFLLCWTYFSWCVMHGVPCLVLVLSFFSVCCPWFLLFLVVLHFVHVFLAFFLCTCFSWALNGFSWTSPLTCHALISACTMRPRLPQLRANLWIHVYPELGPSVDKWPNSTQANIEHISVGARLAKCITVKVRVTQVVST